MNMTYESALDLAKQNANTFNRPYMVFYGGGRWWVEQSTSRPWHLDPSNRNPKAWDMMIVFPGNRAAEPAWMGEREGLSEEEASATEDSVNRKILGLSDALARLGKGEK
jgi:hypothetical protein